MTIERAGSLAHQQQALDAVVRPSPVAPAQATEVTTATEVAAVVDVSPIPGAAAMDRVVRPRSDERTVLSSSSQRIVAPMADASLEDLAASRRTAQAFLASGDPELVTRGHELLRSIVGIEKARKVEIPIRLQLGMSPSTRVPGDVAGILRDTGATVTFYPADERFQPFEIPADRAAHLPRHVPVVARATKQDKVFTLPDGSVVQAQIFVVEESRRPPRGRFIGIIDFVDGEAHVRDCAPPPRLARLPAVDASGAPWKAGAVVEIRLDVSGPEPQAFVEAELASAGSAHARAWGIAEEQRLDPTFPPACVAQAQAIQEDPGLDDKALTDLTHKPFFAIDNDGSRDIDQAMCLEKLPAGGFMLSYALADPSHYIQPGTPLFEEMLRRGASYYLPGLSIPMLPAELSEGVISLNAHEDHRALVLQIRLDKEGNQVGVEALRAKIHSRAQLTYPDVSDELADPQGKRIAADQHGQPVPDDVHQQLEVFEELGELRIKRARERGVVEPERFEMEIGLQGEHFFLRDAKSDRASALNAQMSILANVAGAQAMCTSNIPGVVIPGIFRVHPAPDPAQYEALRRQIDVVVGDSGLPATWRWNSNESLSAWVERFKGNGSPAINPRTEREREMALVLQTQAVRINVASEYAREPGVHSGLKVSPYGRFTAPMREAVGIASHAVLFAKNALEAAFAQGAITQPEALRLWDHLLLAALVDADQIPVERRAVVEDCRAFLAMGVVELGSAARALSDAIAALPAVDKKEQQLIEKVMDRALQAGNSSRMKQKQVEGGALRLLFDDLFRSDLGGMPDGNPHAPVRSGTIVAVTPGRVYVQLRDPDVEVRLGIDDLLRDNSTARYLLDREGCELRREDGGGGAAASLVVGRPINIRATHHDGERLHFGVVD